MKEYQIITTSVCYVKAETEEDAEKEFHNRSDYGDIVDCDVEEFVSSTNTEQKECPDCNGYGHVDLRNHPTAYRTHCERCNGTGRIIK